MTLPYNEEELSPAKINNKKNNNKSYHQPNVAKSLIPAVQISANNPLLTSKAFIRNVFTFSGTRRLNCPTSDPFALHNPANNCQEHMFLIKYWCTSTLVVSWGSKKSKWLFYRCLSCTAVQNDHSWCSLWCLHATHLRSTSHMHARYRQGSDVHSDTAVQVQGANEEEEPPDCYWSENGQFIDTIMEVQKYVYVSAVSLTKWQTSARESWNVWSVNVLLDSFSVVQQIEFYGPDHALLSQFNFRSFVSVVLFSQENAQICKLNLFKYCLTRHSTLGSKRLVKRQKYTQPLEFGVHPVSRAYLFFEYTLNNNGLLFRNIFLKVWAILTWHDLYNCII